MTSHLASPQIVASLRLLAFAGLLAAASLATGCATDHVIAAPPGANDSVRPVPPLTPPATGIIDVAFVVAPHAEVVDFAGPWGVFEYANTDSAGGNPFRLFTVAESLDPVVCSGGMTIVPTHTFENAPQPTIIVVPAMGEPSAALLAWLRSAAARTDLTASVCNGSFVLAKAGLLAGRTVTAHHGGYATLAATFPEVTVRRGARFVDDGRISTAGGLTSGVDLALHVVERYYGRAAAERTARDLEYQGTGWKDPDSNAAFAKRPVSTEGHLVCPVCEMDITKDAALKELVRGHTVHFCSEECRRLFEARPEAFLNP